MNSSRWPLFAFIASLIVMAICLAWSMGQLPPVVASHFNARGVPNDWTSREAYLMLMTAIGFGLPVVMVVIFYCIRWLPPSLVNMPHRDYWLAPERRTQTAASLLNFGLWFAGLETLFLAAIHVLVVLANRGQPAQLSNMVWMLLLAFLLIVAGWLCALWRAFRLPRVE